MFDLTGCFQPQLTDSGSNLTTLDAAALIVLAVFTGILIGWHLFSSDAQRLKNPSDATVLKNPFRC